MTERSEGARAAESGEPARAAESGEPARAAESGEQARAAESGMQGERRELDQPVADTRLERQIAFLLEADRLKQIERMTKILGGSRRENSAEHSWHLALFALVLVEHADEPLDIGRAITMLLLHDLVEIDAGDTFAYDDAGYETKAAREEAAADRLFALLPKGQGEWLRSLWDDFEAGESPEARFANAVDRLQPLLLNHANEGGPWREHGISRERIRLRNSPIGDGSAVLWAFAQDRIDEAHALGLLAD
ncbi:MAG: HD family hydrolase [Acidimicrobiia bacterium]